MIQKPLHDEAHRSSSLASYQHKKCIYGDKLVGCKISLLPWWDSLQWWDGSCNGELWYLYSEMGPWMWEEKNVWWTDRSRQRQYPKAKTGLGLIKNTLYMWSDIWYQYLGMWHSTYLKHENVTVCNDQLSIIFTVQNYHKHDLFFKKYTFPFSDQLHKNWYLPIIKDDHPEK